MHETAFGQQAGHFSLSVGGSAGHGGLGGALPATLQAPWEHRARRVPHWPKSHVVPSGRRHCEPFSGSAVGQSAGWTEPLSSPPSGVVVGVVLASVQAPASAAEADPTTSNTASCASTRACGVRDEPRGEREEGDTRRE